MTAPPRLVGEPERILFRSDAFRAKFARALAITSQALADAKRPYVSVSGGKDSLVVMTLALMVRDNVTVFWSDDELEYPETVEYMGWLRSIAAPGQFIVAGGWAEHAGWFRPWSERPYWREALPGTQVAGRHADDWMAARGHDLTILGTRMAESRRRRDWLLHAGAAYAVKGGTGRRCCPIAEWSADEVWAFIAGQGLRYNAVYDRLDALRVPRQSQRVGPLPLARRADLAAGWPDLLARLEARYGPHWE